MKMDPAGAASLFHVRRERTDMTKLTDSFRSSANPPRNFFSEIDTSCKILAGSEFGLYHIRKESQHITV